MVGGIVKDKKIGFEPAGEPMVEVVSRSLCLNLMKNAAENGLGLSPRCRNNHLKKSEIAA